MGTIKKWLTQVCMLLLWGVSLSVWGNEYNIDSLQRVLDEVIEKRSFYIAKKQDQIAVVRSELDKPNLHQEVKYYLYRRLFDEYEAFKYDSASYYASKCIETAMELNNLQWLNESRILKSQILSIAGLYVEAMQLMNQIQVEQLSEANKVEYYRVMANLYLYLAEYTEGDVYSKPYLQKMVAYQDTLGTLIDSTSFLGITTLASVYSNGGEQQRAERMLKTYLQQLQPATRNYSIVVSTLASYKSMHGDTVGAKFYHMQSAISDVQAAIKENKSLRSLAEISYQENQLKRADYYMQLSMDDANFYNARLRNVQASKMLPVIAGKYQSDQAEAQHTLMCILVVMVLLALLLAVALVMVFYQSRKRRLIQEQLKTSYLDLKNMNQELLLLNSKFQEANVQLTESNRVKEEYVSRFLLLCSGYIDALDTYRKTLSKLANAGKMASLQQALRSTQYIDDELDTFYKNFDISFLNIYPHFVEGFNQLFAESDRQHPQKGTLTPELRIYALVKLGISDTPTIAAILRYSVTTIYTYRSKLKKRAIDPNYFEENVLLL